MPLEQAVVTAGGPHKRSHLALTTPRTRLTASESEGRLKDEFSKPCLKTGCLLGFGTMLRMVNGMLRAGRIRRGANNYVELSVDGLKKLMNSSKAAKKNRS